MQEIAWLPSSYQNDFGKIHIDRDRKVQVLTVHHNKLELDKRFNLDFNTACLRALPSARSGEQVPPRWPHVTTPVWAAPLHGQLYVVTPRAPAKPGASEPRAVVGLCQNDP
jgi:hypothetical protein